MIAERDRVGDLLADQRGADRHAAAERLADRHQVRLQAERLEVERIAGAAEAALHFVGDEQRAGLRARFGDRGGERRRQRPDAAFALHRLGDDRRGRSTTPPPAAPPASLVGTNVTPGSSGSNGAR